MPCIHDRKGDSRALQLPRQQRAGEPLPEDADVRAHYRAVSAAQVAAPTMPASFNICAGTMRARGFT